MFGWKKEKEHESVKRRVDIMDDELDEQAGRISEVEEKIKSLQDESIKLRKEIKDAQKALFRTAEKMRAARYGKHEREFFRECARRADLVPYRQMGGTRQEELIIELARLLSDFFSANERQLLGKPLEMPGQQKGEKNDGAF